MSLVAAGGTELLMNRLRESISPELLDNFQIVPTRITDPLNEDKVRIAYIHDLPGDPSLDYLKDGGWKKFHLLIFVSNWQMQAFIGAYRIPWSKCLVIENSILPIEDVTFEKPLDDINLIYTPTPHRGLEILLPAFLELLNDYPTIKLDVYSSFKLYGWEDRDKEYEHLFKICDEHPSITNHGAQPNEVIREALKKATIFAYPAIWTETSCLCLIEAMSAGLVCVHSNLGALYETAANWTYSYQYQEDKEKHKTAFYNIMKMAIENMKSSPHYIARLQNQKIYIDQIHNWNYRKQQWEALLTQMVNLPRAFEKDEIVFDYRR
jgi:glycosyltransferase involved in cell wall biosynthesis